MLNPQSILSSRMHTNNVFKVDETKKMDLVQREKISLDLNRDQIRSHIHNYQEVKNGVNKNEEVGIYQNENLESIKDNINKNLNKQKSEDFEAPSLSFDDRILKSNHNFCLISLNRLFYSKNCVYVYMALIIFSILVFIYSIYAHFAKLSKKYFIYFR